MTPKAAVLLCDKIAWGYNQAGKHSCIINEALLQDLGVEKYSLFCEKINAVPRIEMTAVQKVNFLTTYANEANDSISDFEVKTNWTLRKIFSTISEIV